MCCVTIFSFPACVMSQKNMWSSQELTGPENGSFEVRSWLTSSWLNPLRVHYALSSDYSYRHQPLPGPQKKELGSNVCSITFHCSTNRHCFSPPAHHSYAFGHHRTSLLSAFYWQIIPIVCRRGDRNQWKQNVQQTLPGIFNWTKIKTK